MFRCNKGPYLRYRLCRLSEIRTLLSPRLGEKVFYQPHANVVSHSVQLLVHFPIVAIVVITQLCNNGTVGECDEFGIDLVDSCSKQCIRTSSVLDVQQQYLQAYEGWIEWAVHTRQERLVLTSRPWKRLAHEFAL